MSCELDSRVIVGDFFIAPGIEEGRIWIGRESGDRAGEGGDFSANDFAELVRKFYEERF